MNRLRLLAALAITASLLTSVQPSRAAEKGKDHASATWPYPQTAIFHYDQTQVGGDLGCTVRVLHRMAEYGVSGITRLRAQYQRVSALGGESKPDLLVTESNRSHWLTSPYFADDQVHNFEDFELSPGYFQGDTQKAWLIRIKQVWERPSFWKPDIVERVNSIYFCSPPEQGFSGGTL